MAIYGFDTDDQNAATGALCVYAVYRSRNKARYRTSPGMWGQIERFTKASAKRATTIGQFLEALKPRLCCETIQPRAMRVDILPIPGSGLDMRLPQREFMTDVLRACDQRATLKLLYQETAWIILLVRDRLEREKPLEARIEASLVVVGGEDGEASGSPGEEDQAAAALAAPEKTGTEEEAKQEALF